MAETKMEKEEKKKVEEKKMTEEKVEEKADGEMKEEKKDKEEKVEEKKPAKKEEKVKKENAVARGVNLPVSMKNASYICKFIKGKRIDEAISDLQDVMKMKKVVPYKGEIPHRKGKIMAGRYPIKASKEFITLLKGLKGNAAINGLEPERTIIAEASSSFGRRPVRRGSRRAKRAIIVLMAKEMEAKK